MIGIIMHINDADLALGKYSHLGLPFSHGVTKFEIVPPASSGKYSDRNVNGYEIIRKDLPKETHYNYIEAPNWGDSYNGTHEVALPYQAYPRDFVPPRNTTIKIELMGQNQGVNSYKFVLSEIVKKNDDDRLLACINLLQENVGAIDVFASDHDFSHYAQTLQVAWEFLPPGHRNQVLQRLAAGRPLTPDVRARIEERYDFLMTLKPKEILVGTSGMERYLGGKIRDDLVVFENVEYGNAAYVMYENWQVLSTRSRIELLSGRFGTNFDRVVHREGWQGKLNRLVNEALK